METGRFDNAPVPSFEDLFRRYSEAVHSIDENIGRVLKYLDDAGLCNFTVVVYMSDNGFALGEHGFYDKRDAFETSIRVPLLVRMPGLIKPGTVVTQMVQNIDIAPTLLEAAGVKQPESTPIEQSGALQLPIRRPAGDPIHDRKLRQ
ncbi:MAG: sulfatase/phosphatase domain-containing protein [Verrucomicrobiia bacterium]